VDDETDARDLLVAVVEGLGAKAQSATSASDALDLLTSGGFEPDILLSDVGMAAADGLELIRTIRAFASQKIRALPAIAVTAYANPEDRVRALAAGYQDHLAKPVDSDVLAAAIISLLSRYMSRR
jgi:CheY-like chemotaxis protein